MNITFIKKLFITMLLFITVLAFSQEETGNTPKSYANQTAAVREYNSIEADKLEKEATTCYLNKEYSQAKDKYLETISILTKLQPNSPRTQEKIAKIRVSLSNVYTEWSQQLLQEAKGKASIGKIDQAIQLCNDASEMNPGCKNLADKLIQKFTDIKNNIQYNDSVSGKTINPTYKDKLYRIDILYEQGKTLFNKKLYNQAKDKFEELLLLDPYNTNAVEYIHQINKIILNAGDYRTNVTSTERMAELEWEKLSPIMPKTLSGDRVDLLENQPIQKEDELADIKNKLNNIIIKNISFEDVPIDTALLFLKTESQKADPTGKGVNFFLKLEPSVNQQLKGQQTNKNEKTPGSVANQYLVTIALENVPLIKAIDYICKAVDLKYKIGKYAVEITSSNEDSKDFETRVYPVEKEIFEQMAKNETTDLKTYFTERGISFPEGATAVYDPKISRLIVRNNQYELQKIQKILDEAEHKLPQISIAAKFVEMQQVNFDELGFEWKMSRTNQTGVNWEQNDAINRFGTDDKELGFSYANAGFDLQTVMHALNQNKKTEILSAPRVTTLSGHKAVIRLVTDEIYPTGWNPGTRSTGIADNVEYTTTLASNPILSATDTTPVGIIFTVLPIVSSDNYTIDLSLEPVVQDLTGWLDYSVDSSLDPDGIYQGIVMPTITARTIQTNIRIFDGETVVMGGVLKDNTSNTNDIVPILGDIPLVGRLFQSEIEDANKTNLLIFTTVQLIRPDGTPLRPSKYNGIPVFRE